MDRTPVIVGIGLSDYPVAPDLDGVQHHALAYQRRSPTRRREVGDRRLHSAGGTTMMVDDPVTMAEYLGIDHRTSTAR